MFPVPTYLKMSNKTGAYPESFGTPLHPPAISKRPVPKSDLPSCSPLSAPSRSTVIKACHRHVYVRFWTGTSSFLIIHCDLNFKNQVREP